MNRLIWLCLSVLLLYGAKVEGKARKDEEEEKCAMDVQIEGGWVTYPRGNGRRSILKYHCPKSHYPHPQAKRYCSRAGQWQALRGVRGNTAVCKKLRCPGLQLEHGTYRPLNNSYEIGETVSFECYDGYELGGSQSRTCLRNGRWGGSTSICFDDEGHCRNPGIPAGSWKHGTRYGIGDRVVYTCTRDLIQVGSRERHCLESGGWSGSEPHCRNKFSFDLPEDVASSFMSSMTNVLGVANPDRSVPERSVERRIRIGEDIPLHIYLLLDASESIGEEHFNLAKSLCILLIEKIAGFEVRPRYGLISYASSDQEILSINDHDSDQLDTVINRLEEADYNVHGEKSGTNIAAALQRTYKMMVLYKTQNKKDWEKIRHVIILFSDGMSNMGGDPRPKMELIKYFLEIEGEREDYLDVYTFGISEDVDASAMSALASHKPNERHEFIMANMVDLQKAFTQLLDISDIKNICGVHDEDPSSEQRWRHPWHVELSIPNNDGGSDRCSGSLVTEEWILTAAHCFHRVSEQADFNRIRVFAGVNIYGEEPSRVTLRVARVIVHDLYNLTKTIDKKVREFYDYDIALVQLQTKVNLSSSIRTICIPCTQAASRALHLPMKTTTCAEQEAILLPVARTVAAMFVKWDASGGKGEEETHVLIKTTPATKGLCHLDALQATSYSDVKNVSHVVTDRFLCTGGIEPQAEGVACQGDSGGALAVLMKHRYIQVGCVSWGVINLCKEPHSDKRKHARDFQINLFKVQPWLRKHLGGKFTFV